MCSILHRRLYVICGVLAMYIILAVQSITAQEFIHLRGSFMPWLNQNSILTYPEVNVPSSVLFENDNVPLEKRIGIEAGISLLHTFSLSLGFDAVFSNIQSSGNESSTFSFNGTPVNATIRHLISSQYLGVQISPTLSTQFGNMKLALGFPYCIPLVAYTTHTQTVNNPPELRGTLLTDALTQQNIVSQFSPYAAIHISLLYSLPLNSSQSLWLMPGISAQNSLTSITKNDVVKPLSLGLTLGLQYSPSLRQQTREQPSEKKVDSLLQPILPIAQTNIPINDTIAVSSSETNTKSRDVGESENPIKPILTGDIRATFMSDKLQNTKSIILNRVYEYCKITAFIPHDMENTFIEMFPHHTIISKEKSEHWLTITYYDTIDIVLPSIIRIYHQALAESGLAEWKIMIKQFNTILKEIHGTNPLPDYTDIDINSIEYFDNTKKSLSISLVLTDNNSQTFRSQDVMATFNFSAILNQPLSKGKIFVVHPLISSQHSQKSELRNIVGTHRTIQNRLFQPLESSTAGHKETWFMHFCKSPFFDGFIFTHKR